MSTLTGRQVATSALVFGAILVIAVLDFLSGIELRVYPLYYAPVSLAAWRLGRPGAVAAACLCALGWFGSNYLASLRFSHPMMWVANVVLQGASFLIVGLLVASLKHALARERALSRTDPLCSLLNRRAFYEDGDRLIALCRRGRRPVTLAYLDLDDFKATNDSLGHRAGDDVLRLVAQTLQSSARSSDIPARLGGDEFAMLLPEVGPDEARHTLERIRDALAQRTSSSACAVSVSIGAVTFMSAPDDVQVMVQMADAVMYSAKEEGRSRIRLEVVEAQSPVDASTRWARRDDGANAIL